MTVYLFLVGLKGSLDFISLKLRWLETNIFFIIIQNWQNTDKTLSLYILLLTFKKIFKKYIFGCYLNALRIMKYSQFVGKIYTIDHNAYCIVQLLYILLHFYTIVDGNSWLIVFSEWHEMIIDKTDYQQTGFPQGFLINAIGKICNTFCQL